MGRSLGFGPGSDVPSGGPPVYGVRVDSGLPGANLNLRQQHHPEPVSDGADRRRPLLAKLMFFGLLSVSLYGLLAVSLGIIFGGPGCVISCTAGVGCTRCPTQGSFSPIDAGLVALPAGLIGIALTRGIRRDWTSLPIPPSH